MTPPPIPDHLVMPHGWETVFVVLTGVPSLIAVLWSVRAWRRDGDLLPLTLMLAGTACCLLEPLVDVLGLCWYPRGQEVQAFNLMGRPIPLFVVFGYAMTFGAYALIAVQRLKQRGPGALWAVWGGGMVIMSLFELYAVHTKTYVYYGHQPLRVAQWPTWWEPVNCAAVIAGAAVATRLRPYLRGWQVLAIIPVIMMCDAGVEAATAWPVYAVLWSHASTAVVEIAGVITWALAIFAVWVVVTLAKSSTATNALAFGDVAPAPTGPRKRVAEPAEAVAERA